LNLSRAGFLKVVGAALLAPHANALAWLAHGDAPAAAVAAAPSGRVPIDQVSAGVFRPHVNTVFTARAPECAPIMLTLAEVIDRHVSPGVLQFSLIFHAPPDAACHGTHAVRHDVLGDFDLFIAPVGGPSHRRSVYEACFTRHLTAAEMRVARRDAAAAGQETSYAG
jgi:hypothetical protein